MPPERREFRRLVVGSALVHVGALGFLMFSPSWRTHELPRVIAVELVQPSAPAAPAAAPKPAPAPAPPPEAVPAPPPPPPPPKPKQIVLPEKPTAPKPPDKAKPKPREKEVFKEPPKKQEKDLDELLADLRGSDTTKPSPGPPAQAPVDTATATTGPTGQPSEGTAVISAEEAAWRARVRQKMKGIWIVPPGFRAQPLETNFVITLDAAGNIVSSRITKKSGNPWYDESIERALAKVKSLPPPPEAGDWPFQWKPEDSF
jgi:outer membrane biosynthesis protein TonB